MLDIPVDTRQIIARLSVMPDKWCSAILKKTYELADKLNCRLGRYVA